MPIFRKYFITGLTVLLPVGFTIYIVWLIFRFFGAILSPLVYRISYLSNFPPILITLLSIIATGIIIWIIGVVTTNIIGRYVLRIFETLLLRLPFINKIYRTFRQIVEMALFSRKSFNKVVFIEYPRKGIRTLAFVTNEIEIEGKKQCIVFLPTTPNPMSGFFLILPEDQTQPTKMNVEEALKVIISGGIILPQAFKH